MSGKDDPDGFVTTSFCDERFQRVVEKIDSVKNEIIVAINDNNPKMPWQAKATIIGSTIMSVASIIVAYINVVA